VTGARWMSGPCRGGLLAIGRGWPPRGGGGSTSDARARRDAARRVRARRRGGTGCWRRPGQRRRADGPGARRGRGRDPRRNAGPGGRNVGCQLADVAEAAGVRLGPVDLRPAEPLGPPSSVRTGIGRPARSPPATWRGYPAPSRRSSRVRAHGRDRRRARARVFLAALERGEDGSVSATSTITQPAPGAPASRAEALYATLTVEALAATLRRPLLARLGWPPTRTSVGAHPFPIARAS
jgi:hypothetical protein